MAAGLCAYGDTTLARYAVLCIQTLFSGASDVPRSGEPKLSGYGIGGEHTLRLMNDPSLLWKTLCSAKERMATKECGYVSISFGDGGILIDKTVFMLRRPRDDGGGSEGTAAYKPKFLWNGTVFGSPYEVRAESAQEQDDGEDVD